MQTDKWSEASTNKIINSPTDVRITKQAEQFSLDIVRLAIFRLDTECVRFVISNYTSQIRCEVYSKVIPYIKQLSINKAHYLAGKVLKATKAYHLYAIANALPIKIALQLHKD